MSGKERDILLSHFATSSWGGTRKLPYTFTEQGVAMLSSVLNSEMAILVNIQIMRTFTKLRRILASHEELRKKIEAMERKVEGHDVQIKAVLEPDDSTNQRTEENRV